MFGVHTSRQAEHPFVVVLMIVCGQKECQHLDPDPTGTSLRFGREWKTNATCFNIIFLFKTQLFAGCMSMKDDGLFFRFVKFSH